MSDDKKDETTVVEITITRDPDVLYPGSYFDVAKMIRDIPHPIDSPEWLDIAQAKIKRFGHYEKRSVYSRLKEYMEHFSLDFFKGILRDKLETHKEFSERDDDMQIYGKGKWKNGT